MNRHVVRQSHISITSRTHEGVVHTDVHIAEVNEAANGSALTLKPVCDARERALIEAPCAPYLRPEQAPECLLTRLRATLDHCCCEQDAQPPFRG